MVAIDLRGMLGKWVKDHPHANQVHSILRFDGSILIAYCGKTFPAGIATEATGVLQCQECRRLVKIRQTDQVKALIRRFSGSDHDRKNIRTA